MKTMIAAILMAFGATMFAAPAAQAANLTDLFVWKGVRYDLWRYHGCWIVRYGQQGWNRNCNCEVRQRVFVRNGQRLVGTVRECSN